MPAVEMPAVSTSSPDAGGPGLLAAQGGAGRTLGVVLSSRRDLH